MNSGFGFSKKSFAKLRSQAELGNEPQRVTTPSLVNHIIEKIGGGHPKQRDVINLIDNLRWQRFGTERSTKELTEHRSNRIGIAATVHDLLNARQQVR